MTSFSQREEKDLAKNVASVRHRFNRTQNRSELQGSALDVSRNGKTPIVGI